MDKDDIVIMVIGIFLLLILPLGLTFYFKEPLIIAIAALLLSFYQMVNN